MVIKDESLQGYTRSCCWLGSTLDSVLVVVGHSQCKPKLGSLIQNKFFIKFQCPFIGKQPRLRKGEGEKNRIGMWFQASKMVASMTGWLGHTWSGSE